jgi:lysophospholipase L1-like esterase
LWLILVLLSLSLIEAGAWVALLLARRCDGLAISTIRFPATVTLTQVVRDRLTRPAVPKPRAIELASSRGFVYAPHEQLGWTIPPGRIEITLKNLEDQTTHRFAATILPDGTRATGYGTPGEDSRPRLFIFGDSVAWGWGLNDEQSFPWLLAARFPNVKVVNLAQNGYGNVHGLLQLRALRPEMRPGDLFVFTYTTYSLPRNVAAPSWMGSINIVAESFRPDARRRFRHPLARLTDHGIEVGYVELFCARSAPSCRRNDEEPSHGEMVEATNRIFDEIASIAGNRAVVAFSLGGDDDPVIRHVKQSGVAVVDIRPSGSSHEWDDSLPYDPHPGPLAMYHYFLKLSTGLEKWL